jgi:hydroxyacylglutathione hydrolase
MPPANPSSSDVIIPFMNDGLPALNAATEGLIHITIPVGMLQCNCSIIGDPATREALVIDPGDEVTRILDLIGRHRLTVKAIVSTHAHIDHVGGLAKLHQYTGAPVLMHRDDLPLYQAMEMQAAFLGVQPPELIEIDQLLKEGDSLRWGSFEAQVIHTPGHTPGSVSLYLPHDAGKVTVAETAQKNTVTTVDGEKIEIADLLKQRLPQEATEEDSNADDRAKNELPEEAASIAKPAPQLFSGDTLFAGSIGRTDLWGGSMHQIMQSLRTKLMHLPDDTIVYPGHGPVTTIGHERHLNPFLQPE